MAARTTGASSERFSNRATRTDDTSFASVAVCCPPAVASTPGLVYPRRMQPEGSPGQATGLPHLGQTLGGKYQVIRLLGEGGMAFVFEASHQRLQQRVAIKVLAPE